MNEKEAATRRSILPGPYPPVSPNKNVEVAIRLLKMAIELLDEPDIYWPMDEKELPPFRTK